MKVERRAVARYAVKLVVQLDMDEFSFAARSVEISTQGLRVVCEGVPASSIFRPYIRVTPGENIIAEMKIEIPKPNGLVNSLICRAKLVSVNRVSQSNYVAGFNIIKFANNDLKIWQDFITTKC